MDRKGQVLVNVLITTVIVAVISAGLAQMLVQRYAANARATDGVVKQAAAAAAMNQAIQAWNSGGAASNICTAFGSFSPTSGGPGSCACEYTYNSPGITVNSVNYPVRVVAQVIGGNCSLKACANDPGASFSPGTGCPN